MPPLVVGDSSAQTRAKAGARASPQESLDQILPSLTMLMIIMFTYEVMEL